LCEKSGRLYFGGCNTFLESWKMVVLGKGVGGVGLKSNLGQLISEQFSLNCAGTVPTHLAEKSIGELPAFGSRSLDHGELRVMMEEY
jgi:hypothetical protein